MSLGEYLETNNIKSREIYFVSSAKSILSLMLYYIFSSDTKGIAKDSYIMIILEDKTLTYLKIDKTGEILKDLGNHKKRVPLQIGTTYYSTSRNILKRLNINYYN